MTRAAERRTSSARMLCSRYSGIPDRLAIMCGTTTVLPWARCCSVSTGTIWGRTNSERPGLSGAFGIHLR